MENMGSMFNKYRFPVLAISATAVLGLILAVLAGPDSDYILFINVCLSLAFIYLLYRLLFKPDNSYSFLLLSCDLFLIICANHFYSYKELVSNFTGLQYIDQSLLYIIVVVIVASLFLFLRFISLLSRGGSDKSRQYANSNSSKGAENGTIQQPGTGDASHNQPGIVIDKRRMLSVGAITLVALILFAIICVVIYCFLVLVENGTGVDKLDMYGLVATSTSYGMTLLFVITAIFFILVILIELASYILKKIKALLNISSGQAEDEYAATENKQQAKYKSDIRVPTYAISILIFFALLYMSYKLGGQTLQDFFKTAAKGDYLILPLTLLASVVAFFILVRVIHGILLFTLKAKSFRIETYIIRIGKLIVNILFRSIIVALKFVKFVPDFFEALHDMVLSEADEYEEEELTAYPIKPRTGAKAYDIRDYENEAAEDDYLAEAVETYGYDSEDSADNDLTYSADKNVSEEAAATEEAADYAESAGDTYYKKSDNNQEEEGI